MGPLTVVLLSSVVVGLATWAALRHWPAADPASPRLAVHAPAEVLRHGSRGRRFIRERLAPGPVTGLALTIGVLVLVATALAFFVVLALVRRSSGTEGLDVDVARWAATNATDVSTRVLGVITELGGRRVLVPLAIVLAVVEYRRVPSRAMVVFVFVAVAGQSALSNVIKWIVDRVRPDIEPLASFSGPSFPSGHSTAAAACLAAFALVLGRRRPVATKAALAGAAVALAVAVGGTRAMLGVHWLTDVVAGLALGWAWFALLSVAFGGRLLRFGAPVEAAKRAPPELDDPRTLTPSGS